jgi:hypothetical protein
MQMFAFSSEHIPNGRKNGSFNAFIQALQTVAVAITQEKKSLIQEEKI